MGTLVGSGWTRFTFFPVIESETVTASLTMPTGTPFAVTDQYVQQMAESAQELQARYTNGEGGESMIRNILAVSGVAGRTTAPNAGQVEIELVPQKERVTEFSVNQLAVQWRNTIGTIPGAESLSFRASRFNAGSPIDIQLSSNSMESLNAVAEDCLLYTSPSPRDA